MAKCVCGHNPHDGACGAVTLTDHFEGTSHGGVVPCGCTSFELDDGTDGVVDGSCSGRGGSPTASAYRYEAAQAEKGDLAL